MGRGKKQRPHKPAELGPRVFRRGRYYAVDLRPWGGGRPTMRSPKAPNWPKQGERTEDAEIADRWRWAYYDHVRGQHRRRVLGHAEHRRLGPTIDAFLEHVQNNYASNTHANQQTALNHLRDHLPDSTWLHDLTDDAMQAILDRMTRQGYRPSTLDVYRRTWRWMLKWAGHPEAGSELVVPEQGETDVETLEPTDLARLRKAADKVDRASGEDTYRLALELALNTGARRNELFAIRWTDIQHEPKTVRLNFQVSHRGAGLRPLKGKKARTALVLPDWWTRHREGTGFVIGGGARPLHRAKRDRIMQRILDTAGLNRPGLGWHLCRHQYARHFIEMGGRKEELQRSLGHASIRTTEQLYDHFHEDVAAKLARGRIYGQIGGG